MREYGALTEVVDCREKLPGSIHSVVVSLQGDNP